MGQRLVTGLGPFPATFDFSSTSFAYVDCPLERFAGVSL